MALVERKIELPEGVTAGIEGQQVSVSSGQKKNTRVFHAEKIKFGKQGNSIVLQAEKSTKRVNAILNAVEAHLRNMIAGLKKDFEYKLSVVYSHFPMTVTVKDNFVEIANFGGEKKPRRIRILGETTVQVKGKEITVNGHNKEDVSQTAAALENVSHVRGGKDKRVFQDGVYIVSKNE